MSNPSTLFEKIWHNPETNFLMRFPVNGTNEGVMAIADIMPAERTHHMVVIAPSFGSHNGEQSLSQYPSEITLAFDALSNFMDRRMQAFVRDGETVKRLVSNNKVKNHPHQVLYIAPRDVTVSETVPRLTGDEARQQVEQTIRDLQETDTTDFNVYLMQLFGFVHLPS